MGLVRNMTFYGLAAIAHNIQKGARFLFLCGLLDAEQVDKCAQNQKISNETQQISRRTTRKHVVLREIHT
jgi:IS5 family transposase